MKQTRSEFKLIYNPKAGEKMSLLKNNPGPSLEDIKGLLKKYQLPTDFAPTRYANHAQKLAREAVKDGYTMIIAAGGDGTVNEVANGLIGTEATMGILPLGTYMNVARMLSIPSDLEKAVMLLRIQRLRKIDVGKVLVLSGKQLKHPLYFLENVGVGIEAHLQQMVTQLKEGRIEKLLQLPQRIFSAKNDKLEAQLDDKRISTDATYLSIANGPVSGASLALSPTAKLNDHHLTVSFFQIPRFELLQFIIKLMQDKSYKLKEIRRYKASKVLIKSERPRLVHVDGRLYGKTPLELETIPDAIQVICGFPGEKNALIKRTYLDP